MSVYKGSNKINEIYKGNEKIGLIYKGSVLVYNSSTYNSKRFDTSDIIQSYIVPKTITKLNIDCVGSAGNPAAHEAGKGGRVQCVLQVTPGQELFIVVGRSPTNYREKNNYNAVDIRTNNTGVLDMTSLQSRLVVAGGGGSGSTGATNSGSGGDGGGLLGKTAPTVGYSSGGEGGSQTAGGKGGHVTGGSFSGWTPPVDGGFGLGGTAGGGGNGGAGWYGGGSGLIYHPHKSGTFHSGGGGGSSYTEPNLCSDVQHTQGFNNGQGYVIITPIIN